MVKIVNCYQEIKQSPPNLMIKQSFVSLSGILSGVQWGRSQIIVCLNNISKKVEAADRKNGFIHLTFIVLPIIITMLGFGNIVTNIIDLYAMLMTLYFRLFCHKERGLLPTKGVVRGSLFFKDFSMFKC